MKMMIENADFANVGRTDERLEIAKAVLPSLIMVGHEYMDKCVAVRRALEIADELIREHNKQKENKDGTD